MEQHAERVGERQFYTLINVCSMYVSYLDPPSVYT